MQKDDTDKKNDPVKSVVERHQLAFRQLFNSSIDEIDDMLRQKIETYKIHNKLVDIRRTKKRGHSLTGRPRTRMAAPTA